MDQLSAEKQLIKLEKKLIREPGGKELVDSLRLESLDELEFRLKELAKHRQAVLTTKSRDEELQQAKNHKSALEAPYREQIRGNDIKSRFIGLLIQELE